MEFRVLGPVTVLIDGSETVVGGALAARLLGVLLSRANQPVRLDVLADALWPGDNDSGAAARRLQVHVSKLRVLLGDGDRLTFEQGAYRLRVLPGELDAECFHSLANEAAEIGGSDSTRSVELARKALGLWRGEPYGAIDVEVLANAANLLEARRQALFECLYGEELRLGRSSAVIGDLTDLVRRYPLRERLHALLMMALYGAGRPAEALEAYRNARRTLIDELGIEPGHEMREIERRILSGEQLDDRLGGSVVPETRVPAQMPHHVPVLVGRDSELAELDRLRSAGPASICVLAGTAGVGKTAIALSWADRVREKFPDGQLYVDLHGFGPDQEVTTREALTGFLTALGVDPRSLADSDAALATQLRTVISGKRLLLVIDNARTADQVRSLLPGTSSSFVLVTSRDMLLGLAAHDGAHRINVERLPAADAEALLRAILDERADREPEAVRALAELCARLPLALRVAAELIRARSEPSIVDLVAELGDERGRLDTLDLDGDQRTAVRAVFSWSYRHLSAELARLFRLSGLHPGADSDAMAMSALSAAPVAQVRRGLEALSRANLIDPRPGLRYRSHDLLRAYALELALDCDTEQERQAALTRMLDYYTHASSAAMDVLAAHEKSRRPARGNPSVEIPRFGSSIDARSWLDRERANIQAAAECAAEQGWSAYARDLAIIMWRYFDSSGHTTEALQLSTVALAATRQTGDRRGEADASRLVAFAEFGFGRYADAVERFEHALEIYEEFDDDEARSSIHNNLAGALQEQGKPHDAIRHLETALALWRTSDQTVSEAAVLLNLAYMHRRLGRYDEAIGYIQSCLALAEKTDDRANLVHGRLTHAAILRDMGRHAEAVDLFGKTIDGICDNGFTGFAGMAYRDLGVTHRLMGDFQRAAQYHQKALAIGRSFGDTHLIAQALNGLGIARRYTGATRESLRLHREAYRISASHGIRIEMARALRCMGDAYSDLGDKETARRQWEESLEQYRGLDHIEEHELANRIEMVPLPFLR